MSESFLGSLPPAEHELGRILLARTPLIDVRAPVEFKQGSIPGSVNLPLLNDEERAAVGTTYKREGQDKAIELGLKLISGEVREERMRAWVSFARANPHARVYCFRGGLRSQSVQKALREAGLDLPLIAGGYKRARRFMMDTIEHAARTEKFIVISGFTGAGKTAFMRSLSRPQRALDLEEAARHRGSSFGKRTEGQPSQSDFENTLALELLKLVSEPSRHGPVLLEDESRKIGKVEIPGVLFDRLRSAPIYVIERSREERARFLVELYLKENYGLSQGERDRDKLVRLRADIHRDLMGIERRLGGADLKRFQAMVDEALTEHEKTGSLESHLAWVELLLARYYDPMYQYHLDLIKERMVFRGSAEELREKLHRS